VLKRRWLVIAQVPDEAVGSGLHGNARWILALTGEASDRLPKGIEDVELDLALRLLPQGIVDDHAARRILAGVEELARLSAGGGLTQSEGHRHRAGHHIGTIARRRLVVGALVGAEAHGVTWLEESGGIPRDAIVHLVDRREVVEDPEGAAMG